MSNTCCESASQEVPTLLAYLENNRLDQAENYLESSTIDCDIDPALEFCIRKGFHSLGEKLAQKTETMVGASVFNLALQYGETGIAEKLLSRGKVNPNETNSNVTIPLRVALEENFFDLAEELLNTGAEINARDEKEWTNLMWATAKKRPDIVAFLLDHGASIDLRSKEGWNALTVAFTKGFTEIQQQLEMAGAIFPPKFQKDALMILYERGDLEGVKRLISQGADINSVQNGETLLTRACQNAQSHFILYLLENGAQQVLPTKQKPLSLVIKNGHSLLVLEELLKKKPYPHLAQALWDSVDLFQWEAVISLLVKYGANINARYGSKETTVLMYASSKGAPKTVRRLLELGADRFAVDQKNRDAEYYAKENMSYSDFREIFG